MEDEPWGPSSLTHFYDPLGIDGGSKALSDRATWLETHLWTFQIPNSYLHNAKEWSSSPENPHSWPKAKESLAKALRSTSVKDRELEMAKAYRFLGQTLHLIADMGCPPHTRNDSHPPQFTAQDVGIDIDVTLFYGDPDPMEDLCKLLDAREYATANSPNYGFVQELKGANRYEEVFEMMARLTNRSLPTNRTIRTDRFKPLIRPDNPYPSPSLTDADYIPTLHMYGVNGVKLCRDDTPKPEWFGVLAGKDAGTDRGRPYIDYECVKSQAAFIMPNIAEAGVKVLEVFVPSLEVKITEATADSGGIVRGEVQYVPSAEDDEYGGIIEPHNVYNGAVNLFLNGEATGTIATAAHGKFTFELNGSAPSLGAADSARASIEFGGIVVNSESAAFSAGAPVITSIDPDRFRPDDEVAIEGTGFGADDSKVRVLFNATPSGTPSYVGNTLIRVDAPRGIAGGFLYVERDGKRSNGVHYSLKVLVIESLSPDSGDVGDTIIVRGTDFHYREADSRLLFYGTDAGEILGWTDTSIVATVPDGAVSGPVTVIVRGMESIGFDFIVASEGVEAAAITGFYPISVLPGGRARINGTWGGVGDLFADLVFTVNGTEVVPINSWQYEDYALVTFPQAAVFGSADIRAVYKGIEGAPSPYLIGIPVDSVKAFPMTQTSFRFWANIRMGDGSEHTVLFTPHSSLMPDVSIVWQEDDFSVSYTDNGGRSTVITGGITPDGARLTNVVVTNDYAGSHAVFTLKQGEYVDLTPYYRENYDSRWFQDDKLPPPRFECRGGDVVDRFDATGSYNRNGETAPITGLIPHASNGMESLFPLDLKR